MFQHVLGGTIMNNKERLEERLEEIRAEIKKLASVGNCKDMIPLIYEETEVARQLQEIQLAEFSARAKRI